MFSDVFSGLVHLYLNVTLGPKTMYILKRMTKKQVLIFRNFFLTLFIGCTLFGCATKPPQVTPPSPSENPWSKIKNPTLGSPQSIGVYTAGCIRGALSLPATGIGYQVMRPSRNRFYGHPQLLQFIQDFGKQIRSKKGGDLLIGDMGMPRGGPTLSGHASHQTGLDVDIWFIQAKKNQVFSPAEREHLSAPSMVLDDFEKLNWKHWTKHKMKLLKAAAEFNSVQRIFVNPVIKREVCAHYKGEPWVSKLRPWWFHGEHFHVRLQCPQGDLTCAIQEAVPEGDGCDATLEDWFTPQTKLKEKDMREHPTKAQMPTLPKLCADVLKE